MSRSITSHTWSAASPKRIFKISMYLRCITRELRSGRDRGEARRTDLAVEVTIGDSQQALRE
jgi:hypothetical protein